MDHTHAPSRSLPPEGALGGFGRPRAAGALLDVRNLNVRFATPEGEVAAVNDLSFSLQEGESLGIVGESGSGKSQTAFALMGLLARNGLATGEVLYGGANLLALSEAELNTRRGAEIAMIYQDPMTALNPYLTVGDQLTEVLRFHKGLDRKAALAESARMLDAVKIAESKKRLTMYPHEFSGGMRQRVVIAMALLCRPKLLIADEPTTALDVTVQAQILRLLQDLRRDFRTAVIMITHDLGVVAGVCDQVLVMYAGRVMEQGPAEALFAQPSHPYTMGLLHAVPRMDHQHGSDRLATIPGNPPNLLALPPGCPFAPRCVERDTACLAPAPLTAFGEGRRRACHRPLEQLRYTDATAAPAADSAQANDRRIAP
ncbi:oligopeptide/dipeptide ABC transporter ATP-binding protein [Niveibacterium microcysteis]|uniref:Oligopeptide ABC transporter ATP-binding protein OppD n=1 Tax=Niveibacterium microcysteis TaxID=2811415 RepID=A0ABX7MA62_9RHOO|nr:oligopeptide/dipeptide ABC transporter ATP-binding protein [Niveibacterium microcysteis]QSI77623.1 oligopeptide ABC transporter ATP-binding protein OppD [Niveibacterium microcysteis]